MYHMVYMYKKYAYERAFVWQITIKATYLILKNKQKITKLSTKQSETEYCSRQPELGKTYDILPSLHFIHTKIHM